MSEPQVGHIDDFGEGMVRKLRSGLGVEAFGVNAFVLEPGTEVRRHSHARQDELYFVHAGEPEIEIEGLYTPCDRARSRTSPRPSSGSCATAATRRRSC
jgi:hypothetical protein